MITVTPIQGDNWQYLQSTIDYCISKNIKTIFFNPGIYSISRPLVCRKFNGKTYEFFSLNLMGDPSGHFTNMNTEAVIDCKFNDTFAIGYQLARSSKISGIIIKGPGRGRDNQYSPFAGIVIDPFAFQSIGSNMYPGLYDYYTGGQGSSGSSGIIIEECRIRGFTVGFISSPNSITLNADNIHMRNCCIEQVRFAYCTTHRQAKANTVTNLISWEDVDCVFDGSTYGQKVGQMPQIYGGNIAGNIKQLFNYGFQQFPVSCNGLFAEAIERIGNVESGAGQVTLRDCNFDFSTTVFPASHFKGNKVLFDSCIMRYYDDKYDKVVVFDGVENVFSNCYSDMPLLIKPKQFEEKGRISYYHRHFCRGYIAPMEIVTSDTLEDVIWLDIINIDVEHKKVTGRDIGMCKEGDWLTRGHPFFPFARVMKVNAKDLDIDYINRDITTNRYHACAQRLKY